MDLFRSTPRLVAMILGVLILAGLAFLFSRSRIEGFGVQGNVPVGAQTSMIPHDTAAATSSNPTTAKPQPKDVQAALDAQTDFQVLVAQVDPVRTNLPKTTVEAIQGLRDHLPEVQNKLQAALANSDASPLSLDDVTKTRNQYTDAMRSLRTAGMAGPSQAAAKPAPAATPTVVASPPGSLTLNDLQKAQQRIHQEINKLSLLRSNAATLEARITQLRSLQSDVEDLISQVQRGKKIQEVPISRDALTAFLKALPNTSSALPPLITPQGAAKRDTPMVTKEAASPPVGTQAVQNLLQNAQYLKWNLQVNLEFNPDVAQRGEFMKRLQATEDRLTALAVSETPIPKEVYAQYMEELKTLQAMLSPGDARRHPPIDLPSSHATRTDMGFTSPDYPSSAQLDAAQQGPSRHRKTPRGHNALYDEDDKDSVDVEAEAAEFPGADPSSDTQIRPGFNMDDATIQRRASSSAYDPAAVGGPDYKKRAQELCRQVQSAQLGEPSDFGCIANPDEVSSSYSWEGNYKMVCNRLGDTWGGWYPEMFGCPKYDSNAKFKGIML
jgi:hypothetical protein